MVVDFYCVPRKDAPPGQLWARDRQWYGWDPTKSPAELFHANRGEWPLGPKFEGQRYATFSYGGHVRLVAGITGKEPVETQTGTKWAVTGNILPLTHPASVALMGRRFQSLQGGRSYHDVPEVDSIPLDAVLPEPTSGRPGWLLTWNPDYGGFEDFEGTVAGVAESGRFRDRWSVGSRRSGIEVGDRLFLLAVGATPGVVGTAWAVSEVFQDPHWDGDAGEANYVLLDWDTLVPVDDRLDRSDLRTILPGIAANWGPRGGGVRLDHPTVATLAKAWADHLDDPDAGATIRGGDGSNETGGGGKPGGQGWLLDAARRKKIEDAAQARLEAHYRDVLGYEVEDVRFKESFDALATKGDEEVFLEAKGTTMGGETIIVTKGEVNWAREHPGQCVMGLWTNIEFDANGEVDAYKGVFRMFPWDPDAGVLTPTAFDWAPPVE